VNTLNRLFATFLYTGYFPIAPATFATAVFLGLYWFLPAGDWLAHWAVFIATALLAVPAATAMEKKAGKDPHCVVIDEVAGMQVVLVGAQPTRVGLAVAFLLFRVFDVWKPAPIYRLQSLPGGRGIVADDLVAGLYTRVLMMVFAALTRSFGHF